MKFVLLFLAVVFLGACGTTSGVYEGAQRVNNETIKVAIMRLCSPLADPAVVREFTEEEKMYRDEMCKLYYARNR